MQLPATTVNINRKISLQRMLPASGEILVEPGQKVEALTVIGRTEIPSRFRVIDIARQLSRPDVDLDEILQVSEGEAVAANQVIASTAGGALLKRSVRTPVAGHVAAIGPTWVLLETERTPTEVQAFISGVVARVLGNRGVVVEANGAIIEAACGFGGEAVGRLKRLVNSPFEPLSSSALNEEASDSIILGGQTVDEDVLREAEKWKVRGIIVGSINASLLELDPPPKVRVVATEGFGDLPMSAYTFGILTSLSRREVSIRGRSLHLAAAAQTFEPPIILATDGSKKGTYSGSSQPEKPTPVTEGSRVRIIQGQHLGASGSIVNIPAEPQVLTTGILALGANVKFQNEVIFVPWANLEQVA
ncbi:MAG: hypothetical protein H6632_18255 [Anaerolineales bacterium]|nr:hypothetical protein [Anaerolineales bacterium]